MVICVECSAPVSCIYRRFPSSSQENIRLQRCDACGAIADKYVEYESLLLFVELLLHKPQTYRHILFNRLPYADAGLPPPLYRLAAACILFDAYTLWFLLHVDRARFLFPSLEDQDDAGEAENVSQQQLQQHQQPRLALQQQHHPQQQLHQQQLRPQQLHEQLLHQQQLQQQQQSRRTRQHEEALSSALEGTFRQGDIFLVDDISHSSASSGVEPALTSDPSSTSSLCRNSRVRCSSESVTPETSSEAPFVCCTTVLKKVLLTTASPGSPAAAASWLPAPAATLPVAYSPSVITAAAPPHCGVVVQQSRDTDRRQSPAAAASSTYPTETKGSAAATAAEHCANDGTSILTSVRRGQPPAARASPLTQHPAPQSSASGSDADRHADMLRWLLHNPLVSADQQLLILSISVFDFVVYIFAIIFFTDLFLRFSFRRRRRQQRQQHPCDSVFSVRIPRKRPVTRLLQEMSPHCYRSRLILAREAVAAFEPDLPQRKGVFQEIASFAAEERTRRSFEGAEERRQQRRRDTKERREQQQQQRGKGNPMGKTMPTSVFGEDKRETEEVEVEGDVKAKTARLGFLARREKGSRYNPEKEENTTMSVASSCCRSRGTDATYTRWTKTDFSFFSSVWRFLLMSASTATSEVMGLLFGYAKEEGDFATEDSGVVLVRYNYLAAAVTLSMFGKLGTLILMAWEESLSPRCFTLLFTFTSNVLAVDVFLNGQHHAAAPAIITAAAAVRAFARLAQQLIFPSVAFPPCVLPGAETRDPHQFTSFLNFLALLV